jgi:hypothetical protein
MTLLFHSALVCHSALCNVIIGTRRTTSQETADRFPGSLMLLSSWLVMSHVVILSLGGLPGFPLHLLHIYKPSRDHEPSSSGTVSYLSLHSWNLTENSVKAYQIWGSLSGFCRQVSGWWYFVCPAQLLHLYAFICFSKGFLNPFPQTIRSIIMPEMQDSRYGKWCDCHSANSLQLKYRLRLNLYSKHPRL